MGKIADELLTYLDNSAAGRANPALTRQRVRLMDPLVALLEGRAELVPASRAPTTVAMPSVMRLWMCDEKVPFRIMAHPWQRLRDLPAAGQSYFQIFAALLTPDVMTYEHGPHREEWHKVFDYYQGAARPGIMRLMRSTTNEIATHFERELWEMMAWGYMVAASLATVAIAHDDLATLSRVAPATRLMAQVLPVGLATVGTDMFLHVLCRD
jgi:hypothetical protein